MDLNSEVDRLKASLAAANQDAERLAHALRNHSASMRGDACSFWGKGPNPREEVDALSAHEERVKGGAP